MAYSEQDIDRAIKAAMRQPTFEDILEEAADRFLSREDEYDSLKFRRSAVKALMKIAKRREGSTRAAARRLRIDRRTIYRIEAS
jgi:transcriptional regulator of acetoin/glycerol metabolism